MIKTILLLLVVVLFATASMPANKVVVIPLNTSQSSTDKLWGKGRPGVKLLAHTDPNGYCTTSGGTKFSLSEHLAIWSDTEDVCPSGTWVCRLEDLPTSGSCPPVPVISYNHVYCDGSYYPSSMKEHTILEAWVADAAPGEGHNGLMRGSHDFAQNSVRQTCRSYHAWCCWR